MKYGFRGLMCLGVFIFSGYCHSMMVEQKVDIDDAVKRLDKHITVLEQFNTKNKLLKLVPTKTAENRFLFVDDVLDFSHDLLRICIKKMFNDESLDPLFVVWRLFVSEYKDIECEMFLQEFSVLLFSIYKNIFVSYLSNKMPMPSSAKNDLINLQNLQQIIDLYNQVSALPLKQLLETLDVCLDQFVIIIQNNGFDEDLGWIGWLQKYWWVPPVVIIGVVVNNFKGLFAAPANV